MKHVLTYWGVLALLIAGHTSWAAPKASEKADLIVIMDTSGSMSDTIVGENGQVVTKLEYAKKKLTEVLGLFTKSDKYNLSVISFNGEAILKEVGHLNSKRYATDVKPSIENFEAGGGTPLADSIRLATDIFRSSDAKQQSLIILSDGQDNNGIGAVTQAMTDLTKKAGDHVMIQFFALGVDRRTWAEFGQLKRVIHLGVLYLVEGGADGKDYFDLTYDAITGKWSSSELRKQVGRKLGAIHAERVHVVSSLDQAATRDSANNLQTIDWNALKDADADLYKELKDWFENLEGQYQRIYAEQIIDYLVNEAIRSKVDGNDELTPTNFEAYKEALSELFKNSKNEFGNISDSSATIWNGELIGKDPSSLTYPAAPFLGSAVGLVSFLRGILETSSTGSKFSDLTLGYLLMEATHGYDGLASSAETVVDLGSSMTLFMVFAALEDGKELKSLRRPSPAAISGLLLMTSNLSASFSSNGYESDDTLESSLATYQLEGRKKDTMLARTRTQESEYARYQELVVREEALKLLTALFPNLSEGELLDRIHQAGKKSSVAERAKILFQDHPELLARIALAELITDELEQNKDANLIIQEWVKKDMFMRGLRQGEELPENVHAYFYHLRRTIEDDQFRNDVELFLKGVPKK